MSAPIVERLHNRIHDAPMPTEHLLDEAADTITDLLAALEAIQNVRVSKHDHIWAGSVRCKAIAQAAIAKAKGGVS